MKLKSFHRSGLPVALVFIFTASQLRAELPPEAQEAMKNGLQAAKQQEWKTAIQSFQEARKHAPDSPVVFYNLGLAESKLPGHELRAICWFGAYLAADPTALNAIAVKEQIAALDVKGKSNLFRLIKILERAAKQLSAEHRQNEGALCGVAELWAETGDVAAAQRMAELIRDGGLKSEAQGEIAKAQAVAGDIAGAQKTANLIQKTNWKEYAWSSIASAQAEAGDLSGALKTTDLIKEDKFGKSTGLSQIAQAQEKAGNMAGGKVTFASAIRSAELIQDAKMKEFALSSIASLQALAHDIAGAQRTALLIQDLFYKSDAESTIAISQMNAGDLPGALKTLASAQKDADLIQDASYKDIARRDIAIAQVSAGDLAGAQKTADLIQDADLKMQAQPAITDAKAKISGSTLSPVVSTWLNILDDRSQYSINPLDTGLFLDLSGYLRSLSPSDNPQTAFKTLRSTTKKMASAQKAIDEMLKQQAKP